MKRDLAVRRIKTWPIRIPCATKAGIHTRIVAANIVLTDYQKILRQHGFKVSMSGKG